MFPAWDPTALRLVAPMKGIANLRSQPPHRGILRISPTNILLTHKYKYVFFSQKTLDFSSVIHRIRLK